MAKQELCFSYSEIQDADTRSKLQYIEGQFKKTAKRYSECQGELSILIWNAHELLSDHHNGSFGRFVRDQLGIGRSWADELRCIATAADGDEKVSCLLVDNSDSIRTAAKLGKKSTPEKAKRACLNAVKSKGVRVLTKDFVDAQIKKYSKPKQPKSPKPTLEFDEIKEPEKLFNTDFEPVAVPKGRKRCAGCAGIGHTAEQKAEFSELLEFWKSKYPHARGDEKSRQKFRDRIADGYTVHELKMAAKGMHYSDFHVKENHLTLFVCLKNADNVNKFIELYRQQRGEVVK